MPRPGTQIDIVDDAPFGAAVLDSGQAFFIGQASGPTDEYNRVASLSQYEAIYGDRSDGSLLYDAVGAFFAEGGASLNVAAIAAGTIDATTIKAALDLLPYGLGPGQVAAPGLTTQVAHEALLAHVHATRRNALLDLPDSPTPATLTAAVAALVGIDGSRFAAAFAPWAVYPSHTSPATVDVPYSAVQAGLIARSDAATANPNAPAAGVNGISRMALGLTQTYSDVDREALNEAGVDIAVVKYGTVRTYGYRTAAGPDDTNWLWFGGSREVNALAHEADSIAENYVLRQIDGQGTVIASLHNELKGMCLEHYRRGALYGLTPGEAFQVDTSSSVNTPASIAAGELHAVLRVKTSPAAEWVQISIVKVPIERALAAAA